MELISKPVTVTPKSSLKRSLAFNSALSVIKSILVSIWIKGISFSAGALATESLTYRTIASVTFFLKSSSSKSIS